MKSQSKKKKKENDFSNEMKEPDLCSFKEEILTTPEGEDFGRKTLSSDEAFPSLKRYFFIPCLDCGKKAYFEMHIKKFCLDKAKVKEAIDEIIKHLSKLNFSAEEIDLVDSIIKEKLKVD